jgi:hypothetical protein
MLYDAILRTELILRAQIIFALKNIGYMYIG